MKTHKLEFNSLAALAARARQGDPKGASHAKRNPDWYGCNFKTAMNMAEHGWPEGAAKARAMLEQIKLPELIDTHSSTYADVTGSYVDVGQYVQGVPECMVDFHEDTRRARCADITVNVSFHAGISPESLMERGLAIAAVVDALESRCIRCAIDVVQVVHGYSRVSAEEERLEIHMALKRPQDALNLDTVAYVLGHPSFLRRLIFAVEESMPQSERDTFGAYDRTQKAGNSGYGSPKNMPEIEDNIMFNMMSRNWSNAECIAAVRESLSKFDPDMFK